MSDPTDSSPPSSETPSQASRPRDDRTSEASPPDASGDGAASSGVQGATQGATQDASTPPTRDQTSQPYDPSREGGHARIARPPSPPSTRSMTITVDRVVRFLLGAAAAGAVGWLLWYFAGLVAYLVVGGLFAYLLRPLVDRLQGVGIARVPAIFLTFVGVFSVVGVGVTSVVPFIAQQVRDLSQLVSVDVAVDTARYLEDAIQSAVPLEEGALVDNVRQIADELRRGDLVEGDRVAETLNSVVAIFTNILYAAIVVPFVTFFLLKDGVQIRRSLLRLVPNRFFEIALAILDKVEVNIGRYFRALLVQSTSIALVASFLLWMVGLQNALAIGIFTGLANTIPYFGPFLGFIVGSLVGVGQTGDLSLILGVALAMGLTQVADNILLQPLIFSRAAQAHPLVILFVVLIGAQLAGIIGMLVAIPLATTLRVVASQILWSVRNYRILRSE